MKITLRAAAVAAIAAVVVAYCTAFDVERLPHGRSATAFTDRTGAPLGTVLASDTRHAVWVPLHDVAPAFQSAIVAAEDARFYLHGAVDPPSLLRAARDYVVYGRVVSGGSTIPMQVARMVDDAPHTTLGKLEQIVEAERIFAGSSRAAILEAYVNRIPMGGNLYGVEAAARTYFGIDARDLDLAQASLLAAIPNDPSYLSPYDHWAALRARQRYVLRRMVTEGFVTPRDAAIAAREEIHLLPPSAGLESAQHLLFWMYPQLPPGTAHVRTTIDGDLQRFVQAQVEQVVYALSARHVTDAAALVVDNRTGDVLAYVGSPDYFSDAALGRNDGVQALRQPGSALKPFTYDLALENGTITSTTILEDAPVTYALANGKLYRPADYSSRFSGPVRVRYALANSLNVPAVRVLSTLGVQTLLDRLHDLGFAHLDKPASYYGLGLTLGSGEVSLWELTRGYLTIARDGSAIPLRVRMDAPAARPEQIGDAPTWQLIANMLADPHARAHAFGVHSVLQMPFPAAVKTGTSSDFRDTWTVGFTRDYTVGVWVGNFDGSAMRDVSGVTGAGPLWNRIMVHLYATHEPPPFPKPRGFVRVPICATTGRKPEASCRAVVDEWIRPQQLAAWRRSAPRARIETARVQIVSPLDGDVYALNPARTALERELQRLPLRAAFANRRVTWTVDGERISDDRNGDAYWPLRLGTWTIRASDGIHSDAVTVRVVPPPHGRHSGFTISTH